jgi:2-methylcitrate dehydratase PrpD
VADDLQSWKALSTEHRGITQALAQFIAQLKPSDIPASTQTVLTKALIDALGCGLYGLTTPWGLMMREFVLEQGGPPESTVWGTQEKVSARNAVLFGATAVHSFDFDDHSRAKIHPGAIVIPTALALAEKYQSSGQAIMMGIAAGYETMNRVSLAANPGRARMRGWHLTGTCGTFAAAAVASVMMGLDAATTASALGLAGTQSAGLWAFTADGAMSKRMHPGKAAQNGLDAAVLAAKGFLGPSYILEAEDGGFLFAMSDDPRPEMISKGLGSIWYSEATCFKPYSCCGSNHACVDAVMDLMRDEHIALDDIARIVAGIPRVVNTQTGFDYLADSVLNAQMSLRYNIAVAMVDGKAYLEQFTPERIIDPMLLKLAKRVEIVIDPEFDAKYPEIYGGRITLYLKNGKTYAKGVDYSRGMPENPMSLSEVKGKFMSLASMAITPNQAQAIANEAEQLFNAPSANALNQLLSQA